MFVFPQDSVSLGHNKASHILRHFGFNQYASKDEKLDHHREVTDKTEIVHTKVNYILLLLTAAWSFSRVAL